MGLLISFQTLRRGVNLCFWWHITPHATYKKLMLQGYFLARDFFFTSVTSSHMLLRKSMKSICVAAFPDLYVMRWLSYFLKHVIPRSKSNARAYTRILSPSTSGSGLPYPIPPCTSLYPVSAWPTLLFQSPHGIRNSDPGILVVTVAADQRTGP